MSREGMGLSDIGMFVAVAEHANFTRAAQRLGTSKSNVGKAVQRLEAQLGTRLFQRTTRAVRLTEDGETYFEAARAALDGLSEAHVALAARRAEPAGRVRMDLPVGFGQFLMPMLASLRASHPKVTLELSLNDRQSDPVADGWDIVVRVGALPATGDMLVRRLGTPRFGLYASPGFLARSGPLDSIKDLCGQEAVIYRGHAGRPIPWAVTECGHQSDLAPKAGLVLADGRAMVDAAIAGMGIVQIFDWMAHPHVYMGTLVHLLPEADADGPPVHALIPLGRRMPPKTRLVLDHLIEFFRVPPAC